MIGPLLRAIDAAASYDASAHYDRIARIAEGIAQMADALEDTQPSAVATIATWRQTAATLLDIADMAQ